jgi:hypothetical protein|tara:strand:- start:352 stop:621 length:270 start_codon:yes stop_codon:yes gene_type:complete
MAENQAFSKAQQSVAQSSAIAIQDATDNLRNLSTITTTAIGVALAQLLATKDSKYAEIIEEAQKVMEKGTKNFAEVGKVSAKILADFPK